MLSFSILDDVCQIRCSDMVRTQTVPKIKFAWRAQAQGLVIDFQNHKVHISSPM